MPPKHPPPHTQLYTQQLHSILAHIHKEFLSFQQLYLIYYESNIKFVSQDEQNKLKAEFLRQGNLMPLRACLGMAELRDCRIVHNRPVFFVTTRIDTHEESTCFAFWKQKMSGKYGSQMRWFDQIAGQLQARKIKCYQFKGRIKQILRDTEHQGCADTICRKFPKNMRNQIQWGTFMAVVRYVENRYPVRPACSTSSKRYKQQPEPSNSKPEQEESSPAGKRSQSLARQPHLPKRPISSPKNRKARPRTHTQGFDLQPHSINIGDDEQFMMKSSLEIDQDYRAITRKFKVYEGQESAGWKASQRAKSAKNTSLRHNTQAQDSLSIWQHTHNSNPINRYTEKLHPPTHMGDTNGSLKTRNRWKLIYYGKPDRVRAKNMTQPIHVEDLL